MNITLMATHVKTEVTYSATFTGPQADAHAASFIRSRSSDHAFAATDSFDEIAAPATANELYPSCEHGLSASLCAGPNHYPSDR